MKRLILFFFFIFFLFSSSSFSQWWQSGGNLIWPYGDVSITNGLFRFGKYASSTNFTDKIPSAYFDSNSGLETVFPNGSNIDADFLFTSNERGYWGSFTIMNNPDSNVNQKRSGFYITTALNLKINATGNTGGSLVGTDQNLGAANSSWSVNSPYIWASSNTISVIPHSAPPSNFDNWRIDYNRILDWGFNGDTLSTNNGIFGYYFDFAGQRSAYYNSDVFSFYSDLSSAGSGKLLGSNYHFYGKGDYPSYFGGKVEINTVLALNLHTVVTGDSALGYIFIDAADTTLKAGTGSDLVIIKDLAP